MPDKVVDIPGVGAVAFPDTMSEAAIVSAAMTLHREKTYQPIRVPLGPQRPITDAPAGEPDWKTRVAEALDPLAHPQSLEDIGNLLMAGGGVRAPGGAGATAAAAATAARTGVGGALSATGRAAEVTGEALTQPGRYVGMWEALTSPKRAAVMLGGPPLLKKTGQALQRAGAAIAPTSEAGALTAAEKALLIETHGRATGERMIKGIEEAAASATRRSAAVTRPKVSAQTGTPPEAPYVSHEHHPGSYAGPERRVAQTPAADLISERRMGELQQKFGGRGPAIEAERPAPMASHGTEGSKPIPFATVPQTYGSKLQQAADMTKGEVREIPLKDVVSTQEGYQPHIVEQYKAGMANDQNIVPVGLEYNGKIYLSDGTHRAIAALEQGRTTMSMRVHRVDPALLKSPRPYQSSLEKMQQTAGAGRTAQIPRTTASDVMNEFVDYGGELVPRGEVIRDLTEKGGTQQQIDRYLQGLDVRRSKPGAAGLTAAGNPQGSHPGTPKASRTPTSPLGQVWKAREDLGVILSPKQMDQAATRVAKKENATAVVQELFEAGRVAR